MSISNCYNTGKVSGTYAAGMIVGYIDNGKIMNCYCKYSETEHVCSNDTSMDEEMKNLADLLNGEFVNTEQYPKLKWEN